MTQFGAVLHQHHVTLFFLLHVLELNRKDAVDASYQRLSTFKVAREFWQLFQVQCQLVRGHGFDDKVLIFGKEEKGAGSTAIFSLETLTLILLRRQ